MWRRDGRGSETCKHCRLRLPQHAATYRSTLSAAHFRAQLQLDVATDMQEGTEIWILLTRHLRSHRAQGEYIALIAHSGSSSPSASSLGHDVLSTKVHCHIPLSPTDYCANSVVSDRGRGNTRIRNTYLYV